MVVSVCLMGMASGIVTYASMCFITDYAPKKWLTGTCLGMWAMVQQFGNYIVYTVFYMKQLIVEGKSQLNDASAFRWLLYYLCSMIPIFLVLIGILHAVKKRFTFKQFHRSNFRDQIMDYNEEDTSEIEVE